MTRENPNTSELERALGGKYRIISRIGSGGFADVYLGDQLQLSRKVAIKVLHSNFARQSELVKRFEREARSAASLSHPNIIDIYDVGESDGIHFIVMKYIDGETLNKKLYHEKRIVPATAIHIIRQLAEALDYAHVNSVIHRDIKPANVIIDPYGRAMLMDFGVARVQYEGNITKTGTVLGTPHYLPPEQPLGKTVDARSDIYSLGIMFYEMLSGQLPFQDDNSIAILFKHINEQAQPLQTLVPDLHKDLYALVHQMMEKEAARRPQSAADVAEVLARLAAIYPAPTPSPARRSTPSQGHNTEQLLLLAREHVVQDKMDKALEIYTVVTQRDPKNPTAKAEISKILRMMIDRVETFTSNHQYTEARNLIRMMDPLVRGNERLEGLRSMVELEERLWADKHATEIKNGDSISTYMTAATNLNSSEVPTDPVAPISAIVSQVDNPPPIQTPPPAPISVAQHPISVAQPPAPSEQLAPVRPAVPPKPASITRIAILSTIGLLLIAATYFFTKPSGVQQQSEDTGLAFIRELAQRGKTNSKEAAKPIVGKIAVTSEPAGAEVFIGTESKGITPVELTDIIPGKYSLRVKLKGYQDFQKEVEITEAQKELTLPVVLQQAVVRAEGTVRLTSVPEGAAVIVAGKTLGKTPYRWTKAPAGEHVVLFQKEGFQDRSMTVFVLDGKETSMETQLVSIAEIKQPEVPKEVAVVPGSLVELGPGVIPPKSLKRDSSAIAAETRRVNRDGTVRLILLISEKGQVIDVKVLESSHNSLTDAALKLVKTWSYSPATKDGVPVKVWFPAAINFRRS